MSDDLAAFWAARLDEDEAAAVAAAEADKYGGRPNWSALGNIVIDASDPDWAVVDLSPCFENASVGAHIVRHDPARALRDIAADRAVLELWESQDGYDLPDGVSEGRDPDERERDEALAAMLEHVARIRVTRWNDHPDYREDWKP